MYIHVIATYKLANVITDRKISGGDIMLGFGQICVREIGKTFCELGPTFRGGLAISRLCGSNSRLHRRCVET
jgi:hypothetical protein